MPLFHLQLFFDHNNNAGLAAEEANKTTALAYELCPPQVRLHVCVHPATNIERWQFNQYNVPCHAPFLAGPSSNDWTTLVISGENHPLEGCAGTSVGASHLRSGYINADRLRKSGVLSADITLHEWLHTIQGLTINGRILGNPDENESGFEQADSDGRWCRWYKHMLRWE